MHRHSIRRPRDGSAPPREVLFGLNPVLEVMRASPQAVEKIYLAKGAQIASRILAEARVNEIAVEVVERHVLDGLAAGGNHQGVAVRTRPFVFGSAEGLLAAVPRLLTVLDGILDPQNLGAIIRAAEVLGAGGVVIPKDRNASVTPTVVRASSGAAMHLPIAQVVNLVRFLGQTKDAGYWIVGLDPAGGSKFADLPPLERVALVIGGEGTGIRPLVARSCDFLVAIPARGRVASLNAAAAAAIGLYELAARLLNRGPADGL